MSHIQHIKNVPHTLGIHHIIYRSYIAYTAYRTYRAYITHSPTARTAYAAHTSRTSAALQLLAELIRGARAGALPRASFSCQLPCRVPPCVPVSRHAAACAHFHSWALSPFLSVPRCCFFSVSPNVWCPCNPPSYFYDSAHTLSLSRPPPTPALRA